MDADLFAPIKKPSSAPAQTNLFGNEGPKKQRDEKLEGAGNSSAVALIIFIIILCHIITSFEVDIDNSR